MIPPHETHPPLESLPIPEGRPPEDDPWSIFTNLYLLISRVMDHSAPALDALGLTPKTFFLLAAVKDHPFPTELSRLLHLPPPTVTYMVKQLEQLGYLTRRPDPDDLRRFRLQLSPQGQSVLDQGRQVLRRDCALLLNRLEPDAQSLFARLLQDMLDPAVQAS